MRKNTPTPLTSVFRIGLIIVLFSSISHAADTDSKGRDAQRYIKAVSEFADNVLKHGKDTYGPKHTPLFVDGLNVETRKPVTWKYKRQIWILSNQASQQNFFRVLDGLTNLTGEEKYRQAACEAIRYAMDHLGSPNGLIHWGGHTAYDAATEKIVGEGYRHEFKYHFPHFRLMWKVDPKRTAKFIEAYWNAHIMDWSNLDMNRHGSYTQKMGKLWANKYVGGKVFFTGKGLTFCNSGMSLVYSAAMLHKFTGEDAPLIWAKRLAHRYDETRNPATGLRGYQYSRIKNDRAEHNFGDKLPGHLVLEGTFFMGGNSYARMPLVELKLSEMLGKDGREFRRWALADLTALSKVYNEKDNTFPFMLTDGHILNGFALPRDGYYGPKGKVFRPRKADIRFFRVYALAARLSDNPLMWQMARKIAKSHDFGDIGLALADKPALNMTTGSAHPNAIFGFLELYKKTRNRAFLDMAKRIGDNNLKKCFRKGFFVSSPKHMFAKFDDTSPLALLHLAAAILGKDKAVPDNYGNRSYLHCHYVGMGRTYSSKAIYSRKKK